MKRWFAAAVLGVIAPALCFADAPLRPRSKPVVAPVAASEAVAPTESDLTGATTRVRKVFKVFDDDDEATGAAPRRSVRRSRKRSKAIKRPLTRKPRPEPAPTAEPGGILELIDTCPESVKM